MSTNTGSVVAWLFVLASFATFAFLSGILAIVVAVKGQAQGRWWWALILEGVLGISAGVMTIVFPGLTELALLFIIAYWAIVTGVLQVAAAVRLRREIEGEWLLAIGGILSVLFGLALVLMPAAGALPLPGRLPLTHSRLACCSCYWACASVRRGPCRSTPTTCWASRLNSHSTLYRDGRTRN